MLKVISGPTHPFAFGVTVMLPVIAVVLGGGFVPVKAAKLPVPLPTNPIAVLSLDHPNVDPATEDAKFTAALCD